MSDTVQTKPKPDETSPVIGPRCLSRRLWDWGKNWGETLTHLVWFWRAAVLVLLVVAGVFAWNEPDFQDRLAATGLLFALAILLAIDLLVAFLNLPLLLFYTLLWGMLTLTSLVDVLFYMRHLGRKQNRIALWVLLGNVALAGAISVVWWVFTTPPEQVDPAQSVAAALSAAGLG